MKSAPYLELCSTFSIKTAPLIRPLLDGIKGGLYSRILPYIFLLRNKKIINNFWLEQKKKKKKEGTPPLELCMLWKSSTFTKGHNSLKFQSTLVISNSRDSLKHFEIYVPGNIRVAEVRKTVNRTTTFNK